MKKEELKVSFEQIKPSESAKKRMLDNILNYSDRKKGSFMSLSTFKKPIAALTSLAVIAGGILTYNMLTQNYNYNAPPEYSITDDTGDLAREDAVAPLLNQFRMGDRHYILLSEDLRVDYGLPAAVNESDVGEKITEITTGPDKSLIGCEVYRYIPAGGEAVVAVKKENEYQLYRFFVFESYNNNQDEDAVEYLTLYGIDKADGIAKIQFIGHSEQSKLQGMVDIRGEITGKEEITRFYGFYSALKNSSDKYFDRLFNNNGLHGINYGVEIDPAMPDSLVAPDVVETDMIAPDPIGYGEDQPVNMVPDRVDVAEDLPLIIPDNSASDVFSGDTPIARDMPTAVHSSYGMMDMGGTGSGAVEPSQGSAGNALANPVTVRIYAQSGLYYDSVYYMNIGFINRYEVSKEFADFLGKYLD